ncbi:MAG: GDSL-type esterase/lipase family protein [Cyanobacteria bacterium P01_A01_bin.114]
MKFNKIGLMLGALGVIALGGSVALNFLLYGQVKKYYVELNQTRLDPLGLEYFRDTPEPTPADTTRVVFWGDSRAASWPAPDASEYEFINRGIGSQTTTQTLQRFGAHIDPLQPDVVVIQVGVNDLKTIALFPGRRDQIMADTRANLEQMVKASEDIGATVIVSTLLPVGEVPLARRPVWSDEVAVAVDEINDYITTLADENVIVFDGFAVLANEDGLMQKAHRKDELHFNEQGYQLLNQAFLELLGTLES